MGGHAKATESLLLKQNEFLMALIKNETSALVSTVTQVAYYAGR